MGRNFDYAKIWWIDGADRRGRAERGCSAPRPALRPPVAAAQGPAGASPIGGSRTRSGTKWILGDLPGQVLADVRPTVSPSRVTGTVEGNAGCNTFSGTYTAGGSTPT